MVIVWGEVNFWSGDPPALAISWEECIQKCLELADCYLVDYLNSKCHVFSYGSAPMVLKKDEAYGTKVAFKRVLSSCPADGSLAPVFIEDNVPGGMTCPPDSFVSFRDTSRVCISIRLFSDPPCQNRSYSVGLCIGNGGMGLTGPYSEEEMADITEYFKPRLQEEISEIKPYDFGIWTDGTRTKVESFALTDNSLDPDTYNTELKKNAQFQSEDGLCCYMVFISSLTKFMISLCYDDFIRTRAAMCRMEPLIQNGK